MNSIGFILRCFPLLIYSAILRITLSECILKLRFESLANLWNSFTILFISCLSAFFSLFGFSNYIFSCSFILTFIIIPNSSFSFTISIAIFGFSTFSVFSISIFNCSSLSVASSIFSRSSINIYSLSVSSNAISLATSQ